MSETKKATMFAPQLDTPDKRLVKSPALIRDRVEGESGKYAQAVIDYLEKDTTGMFDLWLSWTFSGDLHEGFIDDHFDPQMDRDQAWDFIHDYYDLLAPLYESTESIGRKFLDKVTQSIVWEALAQIGSSEITYPSGEIDTAPIAETMADRIVWKGDWHEYQKEDVEVDGEDRTAFSVEITEKDEKDRDAAYYSYAAIKMLNKLGIFDELFSV